MKENLFISIVSPVYGAEKIVPELVRRIREEASKLTSHYEIVLVEDGSPDKAWEEIQQQAQQHPEVIGVKLSRNFGQHAAILAGLQEAKGDVVIVMDCDLQDDPKYFGRLLEEYHKGNEIVYTYKDKRKHSFFKDFTAIAFNKVFNFLLDNKTLQGDKNVGAFSLISRKVVNEFLSYPDYQFHYLLVLRWLGFKHAYVDIEHAERHEGKSSYNFKRLVEHALVAITYQSDKLLRLTIYSGLLIASLAVLAGLIIIIFYFTNGFQSGWASLAVLILFSLGTILTSIGIIGLYIGKNFEQAKNRPRFIIDKTTRAS